MTRFFLLLNLFASSFLLQADNSDGHFAATMSDSETNDPLLPITDYEGTVSRFRSDYQKANKPRLLLYVNRSLVTNRGELVDLTEIRNSTQTKGDPVPLSSTNTVQIGSDNQTTKENKVAVTGKGGERLENSSGSMRVNTERDLGVNMVSEMEAREIEEAFQKPLFDAGARLVDQKIAQMARQSFQNPQENFLTAPRTDKEKEEIQSLQKSADIVIEVLARKKTVLLPMPSGDDRREDRLELIATAINLKDGTKVAQIHSSTLFGFNGRYGDRKERRTHQVTSSEIIQQSALALMKQLSF
jgi:hypothetical protein